MPLLQYRYKEEARIVKTVRWLCFFNAVFLITAFVMLLCCEYHAQDVGYCLGEGYPSQAGPEAAPAKTAKHVQDKYDAISRQYPDVVGYLAIPNTGVRYYVFQHGDDEYYLHHGRDGDRTFSGEIYLDYRCDAMYPYHHLIIYGHNMRNDTMFGTLDRYKNEQFYKENPIFTFNTIYEDLTWEIFAVRVVDVDQTGNEIIRTQFSCGEDWQAFIHECQTDSLYEIPVTPDADDVVLTLVTCSYEYTNGRLLVQARLVP